jgi:uncharacterized protein (DUF2267 family)
MAAHEKRRVDLYLEEIEQHLGRRPELDAFELARTVYVVLERRVAPGEVEQLQSRLPRSLRPL